MPDSQSDAHQNGHISPDAWPRLRAETEPERRPWPETETTSQEPDDPSLPETEQLPERRIATGPELSPAVATYLEQAAGSLFAGRAVELQETWDGSENLLWRIGVEGFDGAAVLKLYPDAGLARGRRQVDGHERFADAGLAPRTYWFDRAPEGLPEPLVVYGWMEGTPLEADNDEGLLLLADAAAAIHQSSPEGINRYGTQPLSLSSWLELQRASVSALVPWLANRSSALARAFETLSASALTLATASLPLWQGLPLAPVHGDLLPENVLLTPSSASPVTLLDWENFGLGDPAREVARLLHHVHLPDGGNAWLERYLSAVHLPEMGTRINVYRHLLPFESLCDLLTTVRTNPPELDPDGREEGAMLLDLLHHTACSALGLSPEHHAPDYSSILA